MELPELAKIFLDMGIVSTEQISNALFIIKKQGGLIGSVLLKNKVISEKQLVKALEIQAYKPFEKN